MLPVALPVLSVKLPKLTVPLPLRVPSVVLPCRARVVVRPPVTVVTGAPVRRPAPASVSVPPFTATTMAADVPLSTLAPTEVRLPPPRLALLATVALFSATVVALSVPLPLSRPFRFSVATVSRPASVNVASGLTVTTAVLARRSALPRVSVPVLATSTCSAPDVPNVPVTAIVPASTRTDPLKASALPAIVKVVPAPCLTKLPPLLLSRPEKLLLAEGKRVSVALPMLMVPAPFSAARVWLPPSSSVAAAATVTLVVAERRLAAARVSVPPSSCSAALAAVPVSEASPVTRSWLPPKFASTEAPVVNVVLAVSVFGGPSSTPPRLSVATVSLPVSTSRPPLFTVTAAPLSTRSALPRVRVPALFTVTALTLAKPLSVPEPVTTRLLPARLAFTTPPVSSVCVVAVKAKGPFSVPASVLLAMVSLPPNSSVPPCSSSTELLFKRPALPSVSRPLPTRRLPLNVPLSVLVPVEVSRLLATNAVLTPVLPPLSAMALAIRLAEPVPVSAPLSVRLAMVSVAFRLKARVPPPPTLTLPELASTSLPLNCNVPALTVVNPV